MKERPIIFDGPSVCAILDGSKTQTRRVVVPRPSLSGVLEHVYKHRGVDPYGRQEWSLELRGEAGEVRDTVRCPYGQPGDYLWVREKWGDADIYYQDHANDCPSVVAYAADRSAIQHDSPKPRRIPERDLAQWNWNAMRWRASIHMPRWASRILLEVEDVRVERLHEIGEADVRAEGLRFSVANEDGADQETRDTVARTVFGPLWDSINAKRSYSFRWNTNPLVWCVSFRRIAP